MAVYDAGGVGGNGSRNLDRVFSSMKNVVVRRVGVEDIGDGVLNQFDLAIFPGGSGSKQAAALQPAGRESGQKFVKEGGGFVGICAGAYLAAANYKWSLALSNHKIYCETIDLPELGRKSMWFRGNSAFVKMELTAEGQKILGEKRCL